MTGLSLTIETDDLKSGRGDVDPGTGGEMGQYTAQ